MKRYRNKLMYLIFTIFIFSFIYSFINPVNFYGMNKIQDQIKDDMIEDKARESFYVETKKEKVERDVEKIVEEEGKRIKEQSFTQKYLDCLYFSIITSCLLGYGDIYPITNISKILVSIQALVTLSLILY
uniref:Potassium channel domain-containing protein n=1 Tax=viral metagenome TaxID=1070528 RepID=A0A6C0BQD5_9ZZZZ